MEIPEQYKQVMKTEPYKHQLEAFDMFKDRSFFYLFAEMGTGKTKIAIDIASWKYLKGEIDAVLIIAPNNVHSQWILEQFPIHCAVEHVDHIYRGGKLKQKIYLSRFEYFLSAKMDKLKVLAVNVEAFQSTTVLPFIGTYVKRNKVFRIADESTRIKTPTAKRSVCIHRLNKYGCGCILTGTPATKSPFDLWSQFEFLKANYFNCNYFMFQHKYGIMMRATNQRTGNMYNTTLDEKTFGITKGLLKKQVEQNEMQGLPPCVTDFGYSFVSSLTGLSERDVRQVERMSEYGKFKNMDELKKYIEHDGMSVRKKDCLDLPEKVYEIMYVIMTKEQKQIYKNLKEQLYAEYMDKELTVFNKLSLGLRLMQVSGGFFPYTEDERANIRPINPDENAKVIRLLEDLEEVDFEATKVIVWAAFVPEIELLYKELSKQYKCCVYYGKVSTEDRDKIKKEFHEGKYDIFIGNTATAGFGLNLQNATLQYYYSNDYRTENRLQAEDRSHRIGVKGTCVYKDIIMKGTIDEKVYKSIKTGRDLNAYFTDMSIKDILQEEETEDE